MSFGELIFDHLDYQRRESHGLPGEAVQLFSILSVSLIDMYTVQHFRSLPLALVSCHI